MKITTRVAMEVAAHEGIVRQAYKDSVGTWTWSVGITSKSGYPVERYIGNPQPLEKCLSAWLEVLGKYAETVRKTFAGHDLTEAQFAAALSFHWNTGAIHKASWVKRWKAGDEAGARKAIMNWRKPPEIIPRRQAERDLFFDGVWSNRGYMVEYTAVTGSHHPIKPQRIDVSGAILSILGGATGHMPSDPRPDAAPAVEIPEAAKGKGGASAIAILIAGAAVALATGWDWIMNLFGG